MNKKRLLLVILTLAIVTSLSAGTLAVYTTTDTAVSGSVQVKKFAFTAAGTSGDSTTIKLAPTESKDYAFTVSNTDNGATAEVPLNYTVTVNYSGALTAMPGLKAVLKSGSTELINNTSGSFTYTVSNVPAGTARTDSYTLTLIWVNGDNTAQTSAGEGANGTTTYPMTVSVTATQNTDD
jgi:hypothetical protein